MAKVQRIIEPIVILIARRNAGLGREKAVTLAVHLCLETGALDQCMSLPSKREDHVRVSITSEQLQILWATGLCRDSCGAPMISDDGYLMCGGALAGSSQQASLDSAPGGIYEAHRQLLALKAEEQTGVEKPSAPKPKQREMPSAKNVAAAATLGAAHVGALHMAGASLTPAFLPYATGLTALGLAAGYGGPVSDKLSGLASNAAKSWKAYRHKYTDSDFAEDHEKKLKETERVSQNRKYAANATNQLTAHITEINPLGDGVGTTRDISDSSWRPLAKATPTHDQTPLAKGETLPSKSGTATAEKAKTQEIATKFNHYYEDFLNLESDLKKWLTSFETDFQNNINQSALYKKLVAFKNTQPGLQHIRDIFGNPQNVAAIMKEFSHQDPKDNAKSDPELKRIGLDYNQGIIDDAKEIRAKALNREMYKAIEKSQRTTQVKSDLLHDKVADRIRNMGESLQQAGVKLQDLDRINRASSNYAKEMEKMYVSPSKSHHELNLQRYNHEGLLKHDTLGSEKEASKVKSAVRRFMVTANDEISQEAQRIYAAIMNKSDGTEKIGTTPLKIMGVTPPVGSGRRHYTLADHPRLIQSVGRAIQIMGELELGRDPSDSDRADLENLLATVALHNFIKGLGARMEAVLAMRRDPLEEMIRLVGQVRWSRELVVKMTQKRTPFLTGQDIEQNEHLMRLMLNETVRTQEIREENDFSLINNKQNSREVGHVPKHLANSVGKFGTA